jgi:CRISPR-associated protein Cas2
VSRDDARRTLIAYDIPDDRRRTKLAKVLGKFGDRLQFSVFVTDVSPARLMRMKDEISDIIDNSADSVLFCDIGKISELSDDKFSFLGQSRAPTPDKAWIL